jgi:type II secretory pathway pseudopilin PulG
MRHHPRPTSRGGFTLVELLVSMALIIFIMTILSTAFSVSLDTFRQLKAIGDMSEQLRSANTIIRRDLAAEHVEDEAGNTPRLSRIPGPGNTVWNGSKKGFFYIRQDSAGVPEGFDADNIASVRAAGSPTTLGVGAHEFGMTVRLSGKTQSDTASGTVATPVWNDLQGDNLLDFVTSTNQQVSRWAEVYYFLRQTSVVTSVENGLPLYTLYRRQRVLAPNTRILPIAVTVADVQNSSSLAIAQVVPTGPPPAQPLFVAVGPDSLDDFVPVAPATPGVFIPANRLGGWLDPLRPGYGVPIPAGPGTPPGTAPATFDWRPYPSTGADYGTDIVLNNVVSMRVQVQLDGTTVFQDLPPSFGNPVGTFPRVYDTARSAPTQIRAMRIQLRVHNTNTGLTRQVSIVQDL